jgi:cytoskeletal protein CcmA (bactofilin family)
MITNPKLKPIRGFVEIEFNGKRMYRNVKTGEIVEPGATFTGDSEPTAEELLDILLGVKNDE